MRIHDLNLLLKMNSARRQDGKMDKRSKEYAEACERLRKARKVLKPRAAKKSFGGIFAFLFGR